ncbi:MAG: endonuclease domain-containing protein [Polyangiaceae bacterium]
MRGSLTATEQLLWNHIRGRRLGVVFRRQVPLLGRFIADFLAPAKRLVVEVDGAYHGERAHADARRDLALERAGYRVPRLDVAGLQRHRVRSCCHPRGLALGLHTSMSCQRAPVASNHGSSAPEAVAFLANPSSRTRFRGRLSGSCPAGNHVACYLGFMNVVRGRVRDGHVELDSAWPDGAEVVVVLGETEPFALAEHDIAELTERMAAADRGEVEPAESVFARLLAGR